MTSKNSPGATKGPLATLTPVFIDVETFMSPEVNLGRMTLRQYLAQSHLESIAIAIGESEPEAFSTPGGKLKNEDMGVIELLRTLAEDTANVFVAHNAAFDIRVLRFLLDIPQPRNVWCTMEGAMGAWPELPDGYSLENIPIVLNFDQSLRKIEIDLSNCSDEERLRYNRQDVRVMQEIYYRQIALIPAIEQEVALRTHRQRRFYFCIDQTRLEALTVELTKQADYAQTAAEQYVTEDEAIDIFNRDDGPLRSVRYARLRKVVNGRMGAKLPSMSLKKINPVMLAQTPQVGALLKETSRVGKMLSHQRRAQVFESVDRVDVELGVFRAHTFRFSSPSVGRGLNLHNIPKHDISIAKPTREIFQLPQELCFVRADLANVEYRIECKITGCKTGMEMFDPILGGNIMNDPYCEAWYAMTRQRITKKDPIRQVAKAAVLGLGFLMAGTGYAKTLLTAIADPKSGVTEQVLTKIAQDLGWRDPGYPTKKIIADLGCSPIVALTAHSVHKSFSSAHWEFSTVADWLVRAVSVVGGCDNKSQAQYKLDLLYNSPRAPDRSMIDLLVDQDRSFSRPSIRVRCGPWVPTLCWREPKVRPIPQMSGEIQNQLSILKSTQFKSFTKQLAIENVTQGAARNALCWGIAELEKLGFPDVIHVHDEALVIVPRKRETVLAAREALMRVFGPQGYSPLGWAVLMKPNEVSMTQSMYESEEDIMPPATDKTGKKIGGDRWGKIERNELGCLENLP